VSGNATLGLNSTMDPLGAGETWTGEWTDVAQWDCVMVAARTDVAGTMYAEFSPDGTNIDSTLTFDVGANVPELHRLTIGRRWFRARYVNDVTPQTFLRLQCIAGSQPLLSSALNETVSLDADAVMTRSIPSMLEIGRGRLTGIAKSNKSGRNGDIDTATVPEWIWENGGVYTGFPDGDAETLRIVSTDENDAASGTGARTVTVTGLDENWLIQSETLTLNGVTPVTGSLLFRRVHTASVQTSGSTNTAYNIGTITVSHSTTTANVFLTIQPGRNQSNAAVYTVPDGKIGIKLNLRVEVDRGNASTISGFVYVREFGKSPRLRRPFTASSTSNYYEEPYGGLTYPAKTDIGIVVTACSANNTAVNASFDIILIDDD
jgi:hypothetical protein